MGYGLVAVPRQLWRTADIKGAERAAYHKAGLQADRAIAAMKCVAAVQCCAWLVSLTVSMAAVHHLAPPQGLQPSPGGCP